MPLIWRNKIEQCAFDGIIVFGQHCEPDIRGNIIANNRKNGIKIMKNAIAHIGGTSKNDILELPDLHQSELPSVNQYDNNGMVMDPNQSGTMKNMGMTPMPGGTAGATPWGHVAKQ